MIKSCDLDVSYKKIVNLSSILSLSLSLYDASLFYRFPLINNNLVCPWIKLASSYLFFYFRCHLIRKILFFNFFVKNNLYWK